MGHVALEVPLDPLAIGGRAKRDGSHDAWTCLFGDTLDRSALAGGVAALKHDHDAQALVGNGPLELGQLLLQSCQLLLIDFLLQYTVLIVSILVEAVIW